jgi:hypothetical protein
MSLVVAAEVFAASLSPFISVSYQLSSGNAMLSDGNDGTLFDHDISDG